MDRAAMVTRIRALAAVLSLLLMSVLPASAMQPEAAPAQGRAGEDLTVQAGSYAISPSPPRLQDILTINVTVVNQGTQNASSFVVAFYLNTTTTSLGRKTVSSLAQGASTNVTATWDTRTTETVYYLSDINYTIIVAVDYDNRISEQNETNNNFTFIQALGPERAPDLKLVRFSATPSSPVMGDTVTVEVNITNTGEVTARFFKIYIFVDDLNITISSVDVSPLNVSEFRNITLYWNSSGTAAGVHTLLVYVNPDFYFNRINELSWSDNNGSMQMTVSRPEQRLELTFLDYSPTEPHMGDTLQIDCTIFNNGTVVENFTAIITLEGGEILKKNIGLEIGQSTDLKAEVDTSIYNPGNYTVRVRAGNIDRTMVIAIWPMRRADLVPRNVTFLPLLPKVGQTLTVSFEAANEGSAASNPCGVGLFADYLLTPVASDLVPSLGPGETSQVRLSWNSSGTTAGSHWLRVSVDHGKVVVESNETNNNHVWSLLLDGDIDLALDNLTIRPLAPKVGETVQFSVRVKNTGSRICDASVITLKSSGAEVDSKQLGMLAPGGGQNSTLKWSTAGMAPGVCEYELGVAPSQGASDVNAKNNILAGTLELQPPPPAPDLKVASMEVLNASPRAGDPLTIRVSVQNAGNVDSGPCTLMIFFVNGTALLRFTDVPVEVTAIPAGGTVRLDVARGTRNFRDGRYLMNVTVDYKNEIAEQNEGNNLLSVPLELLPPLPRTPLLTVEDVRLEGKLQAGASVSITTTVSNSGDGDAYGVLVWFIIDGIHVGNLTIDQVKAGTNHTASLLWTPKEGTHTIFATAQAQDTPAANGPQSQVAVSPGSIPAGGGGGMGAYLLLVVVVILVVAAAAGTAIFTMRRKRPPEQLAAPAGGGQPSARPEPASEGGSMSWDR